MRCLRSEENDKEAHSAVLDFYDAWNRRDIDAAMSTIAEDCVYEDVVFQDPFKGKEAIRDYFADIVKYLDKEVQFKIDDISQDPKGKVGLLWLFIENKFFDDPF